MLKKLSIKDLRLKNEKVLMRVDFNVPLDKSKNITDDTRIKAALPSIKTVLEKGGSVILMSHLGRPKGKSPEYSLAPCAKHLSELLNQPVLFAKDCMGDEAKQLSQNLKPGQVLLLENLRFYPAEEKPELDPDFAKTLASYGTVYVDDAFGTAHRAHSSTVSLPKLFPLKAACGLLLEKEIQYADKLLTNPERPFIAIIGGAKISTKIGVLHALLKKVDVLIIGGAMAYTFMKAKGIPIGNSLVEEKLEADALKLLQQAKDMAIPLFLPVDIVVTDSIDTPKEVKVVQGAIPEGFSGVDIGPETIDLFKNEIQKAKTLFWNGPLGVFENKRFNMGTKEIALAIAQIPCVSVVGGGDSAAAVNEMGLGDQFTHISTGGGALLELIEQGTLPGIEALTSLNKGDKKNLLK